MSTIIETAEQLNIAGFDAIWVKEIQLGDVIMIWPPYQQTPVELTVSKLETQNNGTRRWIGILPTGASIHCSYGQDAACYRKRPETPEQPNLLPDDISEIEAT